MKDESVTALDRLPLLRQRHQDGSPAHRPPLSRSGEAVPCQNVRVAQQLRTDYRVSSSSCRPASSLPTNSASDRARLALSVVRASRKFQSAATACPASALPLSSAERRTSRNCAFTANSRVRVAISFVRPTFLEGRRLTERRMKQRRHPTSVARLAPSVHPSACRVQGRGMKDESLIAPPAASCLPPSSFHPHPSAFILSASETVDLARHRGGDEGGAELLEAVGWRRGPSRRAGSMRAVSRSRKAAMAYCCVTGGAAGRGHRQLACLQAAQRLIQPTK